MDGQSCEGGDHSDNSTEHDDDEPGGAVGGLWGGLGDPHGVDKGVRDEQDELHVFFLMRGRPNSNRNHCWSGVSQMAESEGWRVHLLHKGLLERWQAHTLKDV